MQEGTAAVGKLTFLGRLHQLLSVQDKVNKFETVNAFVFYLLNEHNVLASKIPTTSKLASKGLQENVAVDIYII